MKLGGSPRCDDLSSSKRGEPGGRQSECGSPRRYSSRASSTCSGCPLASAAAGSARTSASSVSRSWSRSAMCPRLFWQKSNKRCSATCILLWSDKRAMKKQKHTCLTKGEMRNKKNSTPETLTRQGSHISKMCKSKFFRLFNEYLCIRPAHLFSKIQFATTELFVHERVRRMKVSNISTCDKIGHRNQL